MDNAQVAVEDGDPPSKRRRLGGSGGGGGIVAKSFAPELASALAKPGASSSSSSSTNLFIETDLSETGKIGFGESGSGWGFCDLSEPLQAFFSLNFIINSVTHHPVSPLHYDR